MKVDLEHIRPGIVLVLLGLLFGITLGVSFGLSEDSFKNYIETGIAANPGAHDAQSADKIWRYAQRGHFHAAGIAAFSIGLLFLVLFSNMGRSMKSLTSLLIGCGSLYPFAWFSMFALAPSIGRSAAHSHIMTEAFTYAGVGGLLLGILLLLLSLFTGLFSERQDVRWSVDVGAGEHSEKRPN
ncbi:MAG: hypothetical protein KJ622_05945 [Alphaproteobacteria bacterium]|nr:hypothetical protein [Alphaproteobacteria bacterium]